MATSQLSAYGLCSNSPPQFSCVPASEQPKIAASRVDVDRQGPERRKVRRDPSPEPSGQRPDGVESASRVRQAFGAVRRGLDRGIGPLRGDVAFFDEAVPALVVSTIRDATKYAVA